MRVGPVMMTAAAIVAAILGAAPALAQTTDAATLAALLPAAPTGWDAADGENFEGEGGGTTVAQVSRIYTDAAGTTVDLTIIGSTAMVMAAQGMARMFANPAMLEQMNSATPDKQYAVITNDGWTGWTVIEGEDGESEATAFTDNLLVKIEIDSADETILATFVDLVPWAELAALQE